jgi:ABC-type transport system involved in cytochrome c biogenesis permease subunit
MPLERITVFCFGASYAVALALELAHYLRPRAWKRWLGLSFGAAGLLAHTLYLACRPPALASSSGSVLFLAWMLAVFYLYGSVHHRSQAWGLFVLPVLVGLVVLGGVGPSTSDSTPGRFSALDALRGERFWGTTHGVLLVLAAVGVSVGFLAGLMYLVQAHRLREKVPPGQGVRLLSLERLERMMRRSAALAFPLLTAGALVGVALIVNSGSASIGWSDPKIIGTALLWLVVAVLVRLRYGRRVRGRRVAVLLIVAFALMLFTLAATHTAVPETAP